MFHANAASISTGNVSLLDRVRALETALRETPVIKLDLDRVNLFAKLESYNPIGSVKDRAALWVLKSAIERGDINEHTTIIESSSGNFASALAFFCKELGLRFIPVIDPNISELYERTLRFLCSTVVKVTERDDTGGFLKTRLRKVAELCRSVSDSFWPNQYENTDVADAHYRFAGGELAGAFSQIDYAFIGVGSGGTITGVSRRLKERFPRIKIVAVDAEGSVIFGGAPKKRHIPGLGSSIVPGLLKQARIDEVVVVPEVETVQGCRELSRRHGLFMGGSSGTVYSAVKRYFAGMLQSGTPNVVFLCPDGGKAYTSTIYNDAWVSWLKEAHSKGAAPAREAIPTTLLAA
jgi:N-(2-amino-2-carboxyethyl)-L-glutamate synthase